MDTRTDLIATREFFTQLWPAIPDGLSIPIFTLPGAAVTFCATIDAAVEVVGRNGGRNVYFGESLQDEQSVRQTLTETSRGSTATSCGIAGLWMDVDVKGGAHGREDLAPTIEDAKSLVMEMGLEPTVWVYTGGGIQAHWLFVEPWMFDGEDDRAIAASLVGSWIVTAQARGERHQWYVDSTKDLARVMRVPGSINQKYAGHVVIAEYTGRRYNPSDFDEFLWTKLPVMPASVVTGEQAEDIDIWMAGECMASLVQTRADSYDDWIKVGMILKSFNRSEAFSLWDQWSMLSKKYDSDAVLKTWESFKPTGSVGLGSLVHMARQDAGGNNRFDNAPIVSSIQKSRGQSGEAAVPAAIAAVPAEQPTPVTATPSKQSGRPRIANVQDGKYSDSDGKEKSIVYYVPMPNVMQAVKLATDNWPRRASGLLFAADGEVSGIADHRSINWLNSADELFAWVQHECDVRWAGSSGSCVHPVTGDLMTPAPKREFYEYLKDQAGPNYAGIECLPHEPPIDDVFYLPCELPGPSQELATPLDELVARFNAETEHDRSLLMAALMTPGWGGPAGARPAFVFTSDHGKGVGKTATATVLAEIWGGAIGVDGNEDWADVRRRLLDDEAMSKRVCLIDNLKGKLSGSGLEGAITARVIDGKKMYVGQASRPNLLTWYITANTPSLSHDLADRSIVIKLGKQKHEDDFVRWAGEFLKENRAAILAEIYHRLRRPARCQMPKMSRDRWGAWQDGVLCKMDDGIAIAKLAIDRRPGVNTDLDDAEDIGRIVMELVSEHFPDHAARRIFITRKQLYSRLVYSGVIDKSFNPRAACTWVRERCNSGPLAMLSETKHVGERGWMFCGERANGMTNVTLIETSPSSDPGYSGN